METRVLKRKTPTFYRDCNPANRRGVFTLGPLRFGTGRSKGKIVRTEDYESRRIALGLDEFPPPTSVVKCHNCNLPSHKGLPPFVKALSFDKDTGEAIDVYVHQGGCPRDPSKVLRAITQMAKLNAEIARQARGIFRLRNSRGVRGVYEPPQRNENG